MSTETHLEVIQEPTLGQCTFIRTCIQAHPPYKVETAGLQFRGTVFIDFLVQVKACCLLLQSSQSSHPVYHVFSCIWKVKLKLFRSTEKDTEELLNLAARPSTSGKNDKTRAPKKCSTKPWNSKQLLPSKSTSALGLYLLRQSDLIETSTQSKNTSGRVTVLNRSSSVLSKYCHVCYD